MNWVSLLRKSTAWPEKKYHHILSRKTLSVKAQYESTAESEYFKTHFVLLPEVLRIKYFSNNFEAFQSSFKFIKQL